MYIKTGRKKKFTCEWTVNRGKTNTFKATNIAHAKRDILDAAKKNSHSGDVVIMKILDENGNNCYFRVLER